MIYFRSTNFAAALAVGISCCSGCTPTNIAEKHTGIGSAEVPVAAEKTVEAGFESPAECYRAFQVAANKQDFQRLFNCPSEASKNRSLGEVALNLEQMAHSSDANDIVTMCQEILQKHGLYGKDLIGFVQMVESISTDDEQLALMQIGASIKDPLAFINDAKKPVEMVESAAAVGAEKDRPTRPTEAPIEELVETKIDGNSATARIAGFDGPGFVYFRRENGSWVVALSEQEPDWKKPIQGRFLFSDVKAKE